MVFQGAVKRWGASIGTDDSRISFSTDVPGSLGQCTTPGRVYKNKHQPGQMGSVTRSSLKLKVVSVDLGSNTLAIKGSVPGMRRGYLEVRPTNRGAHQHN